MKKEEDAIKILSTYAERNPILIKYILDHSKIKKIYFLDTSISNNKEYFKLNTKTALKLEYKKKEIVAFQKIILTRDSWGKKKINLTTEYNLKNGPDIFYTEYSFFNEIGYTKEERFQNNECQITIETFNELEKIMNSILKNLNK